jgi:hypothetical protein
VTFEILHSKHPVRWSFICEIILKYLTVISVGACFLSLEILGGPYDKIRCKLNMAKQRRPLISAQSVSRESCLPGIWVIRKVCPDRLAWIGCGFGGLAALVLLPSGIVFYHSFSCNEVPFICAKKTKNKTLQLTERQKLRIPMKIPRQELELGCLSCIDIIIFLLFKKTRKKRKLFISWDWSLEEYPSQIPTIGPH